MLYSRVLTQGDSAPRGHMAMSGDICGCQDWEYSWPKPGMLLNVLQCPGRPHRESSGPDASSDKGQRPAVVMKESELLNGSISQMRKLNLSTQLLRGRARL